MSNGKEMSTLVENPYVGPRSFSESDSGRFYGRALEARNIINLTIANPVLLLYSPFFAGKTSLMNAQILPDLKKEGFEVWPVTRVSYPPGYQENINEIENIFIYSVLTSWDLGEKTKPALPHMTFQDYLATKEPLLDDYGDPIPRIIVFDQLEEIFTMYPGRWKERDNFFEQIGQALRSDKLLRIIFSIREEYLAQLDTYAHLIPGGLRNRFRLERLRPENAKSALEGPISRTNRSFAPGVVDSLIDELRAVQTAGPFGEVQAVPGEFIEPVQLQIVAYQLWEYLPAEVTTITIDNLREFGDIEASLTNFYEDAIQSVLHQIDISESQLRNWFDYRLITEAGTRGLVYQGEVETAGLPNEAVELLLGKYLLHRELRAGGTWIELVNDRFISPIMQANEKWRATLPPLFKVAEQWDYNGRDPQMLFQEEQLSNALTFAATNEITPLVHAFLAASQEAQEQRQRIKHLKLSRLGLLVGIAIGLIAGILGTLLVLFLLG